MRISIIIPVLNDAPALKRLLHALRGCDAEIIVVDGGVDDDCSFAAKEAQARYLSCERGRGAQMNCGAKIARGEWLWFLHADCLPAAGSIDAITMLNDVAVWGCFRHRIDAPSLMLRVIERVDNLRARWVGLPYGDQGIFVRRRIFEKLHGFPVVPLLEDLQFAQKLKRIARPRVLTPILSCDARRWLQRGVLRNTFNNWRILWKYHIRRASPESLAPLYRDVAAPKSN